MFMTITSSPDMTPEKSEELRRFLAEFLPRMAKQPGVLAIYDFESKDRRDGGAVVLWESEDAAMAYRESPLIQEVQAKGKELGITFERKGYEVNWSTRSAPLQATGA